MVAADEFIGFAAGVFGVPPATLSLETTYGSIPAWDSMAQLRLVMDVAAKYGTEIPFADVVNVTSLWEFLRRINGGVVKKVVAVDLDNTLWDGVVGEDGVDGIRPRVAFQRELKELKARGVLLVALSKNNAEDGLLGLARQPVLTPEDFVALKIDWKAKAENLAQVAAELNLGTDAFVFVDDNPAERLELSARLPEVAVAAFPPRLAAYFPARPLTAEDRCKTEEYRAEAQRKRYLSGRGDVDVWTALGVELDVHELRDAEVARVAQLSQKANQFNVRTHRHTEADVRRLAAEGLVVTAHAKDRFGDQGLVAFVIVRDGEILDWVMSCRVLGRGIEERVEAAVEWMLAERGAVRLTALWRASGKNVPVRDLFDRLGFALVSATEDERRYVRSLAAARTQPPIIR
ncbi:MAG: HAD-IIIC family phosphatase [Kiritimatiellia bacterium]